MKFSFDKFNKYLFVVHEKKLIIVATIIVTILVFFRDRFSQSQQDLRSGYLDLWNVNKRSKDNKGDASGSVNLAA